MSYSEIVLDHFYNPRHAHRMEDADVVGRAGEPDGGGPFMLLYLKVDGERIARASFQTYGCAPAIAAGSLVSERLTGTTLTDAATWDEPSINEALGGLPAGKRNCSAIAATALENALRQLGPPRVFDGFTFFNELDVLEVRLHELDPVVDTFVLVEATRTFSGKPKPLHFEANKGRFERFLPKIRHVVVEDLPLEGDPWGREAFQRDAIVRGLEDATPKDFVLVSDVDEIPRAEAVRGFLASGRDAAVFVARTYYYKLNCENVSGETLTPLTAAIRRKDLGTPHGLRARRFGLEAIPEGGWHFSYLGDEAAIRTKVEAYSHQELNRPEITAADRVRDRIERGADLFDRAGYEWRYVPLDARFPRHVLENQERFAKHVGRNP